MPGRSHGETGAATNNGLHDEASFAMARRDQNCLHRSLDAQGVIRGLYRAHDAEGRLTPLVIAIDRSLRLLFTAPVERVGEAMVRIAALGNQTRTQPPCMRPC
jgi:hypothetical protein